MKDYKNSINQVQNLQYLADRSKITSTIVKNPIPLSEEPIVEEPTVEEQPIEAQQPIVEEPTVVEPIEETKTNEPILIKKKKYDEQ